MDYKNFVTRIISSLFLIFVFFIIFFYFTENIFYFISIAYIFILIEIILNFKKFKTILISYILVSYIFALIYFSYNFNIYEFVAIIFLIICFDTCCYLVGKKYGKRKILFKISPNKTYEGLIGGILITNLISLTLLFNIDLTIFTINHNIIFFTNIVICFSFFGDVIQSFFKRINSLKDSSNVIPGHGGFFDRFDSFLLVIIFVSLLNLI